MIKVKKKIPITHFWDMHSVGRGISVKEYFKKKDVLLIKDKDIDPIERVGSVPQQGYVWVD